MDHFSHDSEHGGIVVDSAANRSDARDSLLLAASFRVIGQKVEHLVRIRNLSAGGLMAELDRVLEIGTPVEVNVRGVGWVQGQVAWVAAGRVGVAFNRQIDPRAARKPVVAPKVVTLNKPIKPLL
jgi:hypothetical protein